MNPHNEIIKMNEFELTLSQYKILQMFKSQKKFYSIDQFFKMVFIFQNETKQNPIFNYKFVRQISHACFSTELHRDLSFLMSNSLISRQNSQSLSLALNEGIFNKNNLNLIHDDSSFKILDQYSKLSKKDFDFKFYYYSNLADYEIGDFFNI